MTDHDRRLSITIVAHDVGLTGGMERALFEVVQRLQHQADVAVISATLDPALRPGVRWTKIRVPQRPFLVKYLAFATVASWHTRHQRNRVIVSNGALVPNRVDVVWVHFSHRGFLRAMRAGGTEHSSPYQRVVRGVSRTFERWSYRPGKAEVLAAVSADAAAELQAFHPDSRVAVVPNGVAFERFFTDEAARRRVRSELNLTDDTIVALFAGGDWQRKGLPAVLHAIASLVTEAPQLRLVIAGTGDRTWLDAETTRLNISELVTAVGFRDDIAAVMNAADVLISPSSYETFNLAVYEAAAVGLPVCATPVAGVRSLIVDGVTGVLIEPNADSIVRGLRRFVSDPELSAQMSAAAQTAVATYTWDHTADQILALCTQAARN